MTHFMAVCASSLVMHQQGLKEQRPLVIELPTLVLHILCQKYQLSERVSLPHVLFVRGSVLVLLLSLSKNCLMS